MIIRPYEKKDFKGIVEVIHAVQKIDCWPEIYPKGWSVGRIRQEFSPIKDYWSSCFLVAEDNKKIAGLIAGHGLWMFVRKEIPHLKRKFGRYTSEDGFYYYQRDLIIHPDAQRRRLGHRLVKEFMKRAEGCNKVFTRTPPQNRRGIEFFEKIGYRRIFRDNNPERVYFMTRVKEA